jgi:hypothetical protein
VLNLKSPLLGFFLPNEWVKTILCIDKTINKNDNNQLPPYGHAGLCV